MQPPQDEIVIRDNPDAQRFEAQLGEHLAKAEYRRSPGVITFTHTEVPAELQGHGVANKLIQAALDQSRAEGLAVIPLCPFVAAFIRRHPAYRDLVPERYRRLVS